MEAVAWNRALDQLAKPDSDCYTLFHTAQDRAVLDGDGPHLPKALAYSRYAADYVVTGVVKVAALPAVCSVGAATRALQAPGAQRALVVVVPEVALVGGVVWGAAGGVVQGGCAAGCMLGATYHVTAAGLHGARVVVGKAARITADAATIAARATYQAVTVAVQATQRAVDAAWTAVLQGVQTL